MQTSNNAKTVSNVAHNWAHNTGRVTNAASLSYAPQTGVIKSYATAVGVNINNETYLLTLRSYSVTTAKHMSYIRRAIPLSAKVITMYNVLTDLQPEVWEHEANINYWLHSLQSDYTSLLNARNKAKYIEAINATLQAIKDYAGYYHLNMVTAEMFTAIRAFLITWESEDRDAMLKADKIAHAEKEAIKAKNALTKYEGILRKWRMFEVDTISGINGYAVLRYHVGMNEVQTSLGIKIDANVALPLYARIMQAVDNGGCTNCGKFEQWGINEITLTHVVIGCHKIAIEEIRTCYAAIQSRHNDA